MPSCGAMPARPSLSPARPPLLPLHLRPSLRLQPRQPSLAAPDAAQCVHTQRGRLELVAKGTQLKSRRRGGGGGPAAGVCAALLSRLSVHARGQHLAWQRGGAAGDSRSEGRCTTTVCSQGAADSSCRIL